jgi:nitroimidazol reductase NimA-like FMN-containing flavoprotein (pyridoxamine 5'-phosphate oxidase superfamily)
MPMMGDYGVEATTWSPLPWTWAAERLVPGRNYWVVTVSADGRPHALPVWGVWDDGENRFAFSCAPGSRKARNLADNPRVVVMPESTVECISVEGVAAPVATDERQERWIERYLTKYEPLSEGLDADFLRANRFFEVVPDRALAVIEREDEFSTRATRWVFDAQG